MGVERLQSEEHIRKRSIINAVRVQFDDFDNYSGWYRVDIPEYHNGGCVHNGLARCNCHNEVVDVRHILNRSVHDRAHGGRHHMGIITRRTPGETEDKDEEAAPKSKADFIWAPG